MNTANATPRPATVTNPPPCASNAGAPAVLAVTVPAEVVLDAEPLVDDEALPLALAEAAPELEAVALVELPLPEPLVPVAVEDAVAADASVAPVAEAVFDAFDLLEEDCPVVNH